MIQIRANALQAVDYPGMTDNTKIVHSLRGGGQVITWSDYARTWTHFVGSRAGDELVSLSDLQLVVRDILQAAASDSHGIITVTLQGDRQFVIPQHHWPVFQITG